jgi:hypothetical protein
MWEGGDNIVIVNGKTGNAMKGATFLFLNFDDAIDRLLP